MYEFIAPLLTLILLEIILGIDNIIFISILAGRLPENQQRKLRLWGLGLAMVMRLVLLFAISWIMKLQSTLFTLFENEISGKDLVLLIGGLFLIYKSASEILHKTEEEGTEKSVKQKVVASFKALLIQVLILDLVFSLDSIITAIGLVDELWIMYTAVIISVVVMMLAAKSISDFINRHPSFKILALCFLLIIGISLLAEGLDVEIPKGYIYFAMAFSFLVDFIQMKKLKPNQS